MDLVPSKIVAVGVLAALSLQACHDQRGPTESTGRSLAASLTSPDQPGRYVVLFAAERVPGDFGDRIAMLGGSVEASLDSIGVAAVTGLSETAAAELGAAADVRAVESDPITGNDDQIDTDLAGLVDLEHSISLVPEDVTQHYPGRLPFSDLFWHGTAAASVVGSNATIVAGLNRFITLLAVKVADSTDQHTAGRLIAGIVYAADQGADVINVSRGSQRDKSQSPGTVAAFERAVNYAFRKGALVVSVPFNDAADLDHNGDIVRLPCEAANAICVSATGPTAAASLTGPWENVDAIAPYSSYGRSAISVAAPGGAGAGGGFRAVWLACTTTPSQATIPPACRNHLPVAGGVGTSWAAPHVAGLAALLVAKLGHGQPALIRARILQSADDLGDPGVDPFYGKGRINVARALGGIP
jgi:hypothetical protein